MLPQIVLRSGKRNLHERAPLRPLRFPNQTHVRFPGEPVALARIAGDAGANHVFPGRRSAPVARHDMIQIKIAPVKEMAAILAGVFVALEHIVAREFYLLFWEPIEHQQHNHPGNADLERNRCDHLMLGCGRRQIAPALEIVREKVVGVIGRNNLGVPRIDERKSPAGRADVYRLPKPVEHQNLTVQQSVQVWNC